MFVYFLSRKGWLKYDTKTDYLNELWKAYEAHADHDNFYRDRLTFLFFEGLNNPDSRDVRGGVDFLIGEVPFLNGGLFEKSNLDKTVERERIPVPDDAIRPLMTDLFDQFNFTVMESTPFDIEVAVDPEMLGKVFEELVTGRHDSGAYYTPRPVVSFMCREALKGYLESRAPKVPPETIAAFVDERETTDIGINGAQRLAAALAEVTVVDPACGSGAYLLGMMHELVELQQALFNVGVDSKSLYDLKLEIIRRNLHGVDLDPFAVNIAMLRLWLSLAIEFDDDEPEPLPNLDFKIVQGDSLLGPDPSQLSFDSHAIQQSELGALKGQYLRAQTSKDKNRLRQQINAAKDQIRSQLADANVAEGVVDWRIEFAEVLAVGGFDIAVANPPYVRQENIGNSKTQLTRLYRNAVTARSDLYCHFYARALQLLNEGGMHVFVCSNSWLDVGYGGKLQAFLLEGSKIRAIYESALERQFSTAAVNTIISVLQRSSDPKDEQTTFVSLRGEFAPAMADSLLRREILKSRTALIADGSEGKNYRGDKWGGKHLRAPDIYHHIRTHYADQLVRLADISIVRRGVTTGANRFFFPFVEDIEAWGIEPEFLLRVMTTPQGSSELFVKVNELPKHVFVCHKEARELAGTNALDYIRWGESEGFHRRSTTASRHRWYDLGERERVQLAINKFIDTTARTYLSSEPIWFSDNFQTVEPIRGSTRQLCVALNATMSQLFLNIEARANFGEGVLELQTYEFSDLLIANPERIAGVEQLSFGDADWDPLQPSPTRRQIDERVSDVLGLSAGEQDAVFEGVAELIRNRKKRAKSK